MKKHKFSITAYGALPYLQFPDLQAYFDSLSLKDLKLWDKKASQDEVHPDLIHAAMAIYCRELGSDSVSLTQDEIAEITDKFFIAVGLYHNVRIGQMRIVKGRMSLTNDNCSFALTDAGIKYVEAMPMKSKPTE